MRSYFLAFSFLIAFWGTTNLFSENEPYHVSQKKYQQYLEENRPDKQYVLLQDGVNALEKIDLSSLHESQKAAIYFNKALFYEGMKRYPLVLANLLRYQLIYPRDNQVKTWIMETKKALALQPIRSQWYEILVFVRSYLNKQELLGSCLLLLTLSFGCTVLSTKLSFFGLKIIMRWLYILTFYLVAVATVSYFEPNLAVVLEEAPLLKDPTTSKSAQGVSFVRPGTIVYTYSLDRLGGWVKVEMDEGGEGYLYEKALIVVNE